jgi:hypothetical protein
MKCEVLLHRAEASFQWLIVLVLSFNDFDNNTISISGLPHHSVLSSYL